MTDGTGETQVKAGPTGDGRRSGEGRSLVELVRSIAEDLGALVRKEIELARRELMEAIAARAKAVAAFAVAGLMGLFAMIFLALAAASALDIVLPAWASRLIVAGAFLLLAGAGAAFGLRRLKRPSLAPEETKRTIKEDVEWARAQLKR